MGKDITKKCRICKPTKKDMDSDKDNLAKGKDNYQAFIIDNKLIFNRNLGYPNKPLLEVIIKYCPNCGSKI